MVVTLNGSPSTAIISSLSPTKASDVTGFLTFYNEQSFFKAVSNMTL